MTTVVVEPEESFESALERFKKQCEQVGLLSEKRQHYEKPSARRKRQARVVRTKARRRERTSD